MLARDLSPALTHMIRVSIYRPIGLKIGLLCFSLHENRFIIKYVLSSNFQAISGFKQKTAKPTSGRKKNWDVV